MEAYGKPHSGSLEYSDTSSWKSIAMAETAYYSSCFRNNYISSDFPPILVKQHSNHRNYLTRAYSKLELFYVIITSKKTYFMEG